MDAEKNESRLKKTLWKLAYARHAVAHVLVTCDFYLRHIQDERHPMHVPLMCSICVTYARPFPDNSGVGMISSKFARYSDPKLQATHDSLWRSRKQFYAHNDATLSFVPVGGDTAPLQQIRVAVSRRNLGHSDELTFGLLCPEIRLRDVIIPDVRDLCLEFDKRLMNEISSTMHLLFDSKTESLVRALNEAKSDYVELPIEIVDETPETKG